MRKESILAILWEGNQQIPDEFIPREWFTKFEDVLDLCFIIDLGWVYPTAGARVLIDYCWESLCLYRGLNLDDEFDDIEDFMKRQSVTLSKSKSVNIEKKRKQNQTINNEKAVCNRELCTEATELTDQFCFSCQMFLHNSLANLNTTKILNEFAGLNGSKVFDSHDGGDWDLGGKEAILTSIWESKQQNPSEAFMSQEWFIKFEYALDTCFIIDRGWAYATEDGSEIINSCWEILCLHRDLDPDDEFEDLENFLSACE